MRLLVLVLLLLLIGSPAQADELRPSAIQFVETAPGRWDLAWKQQLAAAGDAEIVVPDLPSNCRLMGDLTRRVAALALLGHVTVACDGPVAGKRMGWSGVEGRGDALLRVAPLGRPVQAFRLTAENPWATIATKPARWQVAGTYFRLGVIHILTGWDHLLFVIALVLLVARPRRVILAATAFTLAHSLTLAAVTLGFAGLPQARVEALIALSIVVLAAELARGTQGTLTRRLPWLVAFAFGLIHGFGFASALREIGMPEGEVPMALVSFNVGVEAGQVIVISVVLALLAALHRFAANREAFAIRAASYAIGSVASFWLIDRVIG